MFFRFSNVLCFTVLVAICMLCSCKHRYVDTGFYYWKTSFKLENTERALLKETGSKVLYLRYFDLSNSWSGILFPVVPDARIEFADTMPSGLQVVPVVFIPNDVLASVDSALIPQLAEKMRRKIERMSAKANIAKVKEYQLDCDWSAKTKGKFFTLVSEFKKQISPARVSVTLRLHQYKYSDKTGVPPADKALLMFYNMGKLRDYGDANSNYILDLEEAAKYLTNPRPYPLPLDIGLPVYSQGVLFENNKYRYLLTAEDVESAIDSNWLKPTGGNWYQATGDSMADWTYRDTSCRVRYEKVTKERLAEAASMLKPVLNTDSCRVVFFHLDKFQCKNFTSYDFKKVVAGF